MKLNLSDTISLLINTFVLILIDKNARHIYYLRQADVDIDPVMPFVPQLQKQVPYI